VVFCFVFLLQIFDLKLDKFGPYVVDYSRNGRHLVFGGEKGHLALVDWHRNKLQCEINVKENVRDVTFLHNETMFAVAQKQYVYIYDKQGTELHRMKDHVNPLKLEFLPYHFLLATVVRTKLIAIARLKVVSN
jgi:U3 small nucleolar RNA-associated protein 7